MIAGHERPAPQRQQNQATLWRVEPASRSVERLRRLLCRIALRKLGAPTATYDAEFTGIDGVRELKDGRVILLDAQDKAIRVLDLKARTGTKIGREGDGPGEFRLPLDIWPAGGDSAVVRDMARFGKLMVITAKGEIGGFVSMLDSALSTRNFNPTAADRFGTLYALEYTASAGIGDSGRIVRWDRQRGTRDTVARFTATVTPPTAINPADMIRDVYAEPYRVAYIKRDGSRIVGSSIAYQPVPVTEAERDEWRAAASRARPSISQMRGGPVVATFRKSPIPDNVIGAMCCRRSR